MFGMKKKEHEAAEQKRTIEQNREAELKARIAVRRALSSMKRSYEKLDAYKKTNLEEARRAAQIGNGQALQRAKSVLKICINQQRCLESMISHAEFSMQMNDVNKVICEFMDCITTISEQMQHVTPTLDVSKAQAAYAAALGNNANQLEALDAFLSTAADNIDSIGDTSGGVTDEEIDRLIDNQAIDKEADIDKEIECRLNDVSEKLNS